MHDGNLIQRRSRFHQCAQEIDVETVVSLGFDLLFDTLAVLNRKLGQKVVDLLDEDRVGFNKIFLNLLKVIDEHTDTGVHGIDGLLQGEDVRCHSVGPILLVFDHVLNGNSLGIGALELI